MEVNAQRPGTPTVAIIGGGFSGTMLAIHLMRQQIIRPLTITIIERTPRLGNGVSYGTRYPRHLLNVPAGKMSAFPDQPDHFLAWALRRDPHASAGTFFPRSLYADYLTDVLAETRRHSSLGIHFEHVWDEAIAIEEDNSANCLRVALHSGHEVRAEHAVLALGNLIPCNPPLADPTFYGSPRYVQDPWATGDLSGLPPDDAILMIGTGLTMVDQLLQLRDAGHRGPIHALSRHGLLPQAHRPASASGSIVAPVLPDRLTTRALLRAVRAAVRKNMAQGGDWRSTIDALRPVTQDIWQALPHEERTRFLRHVRTYWDVHRHRVAPMIGNELGTLCASGGVHVHAGRLTQMRQEGDAVAVVYRARHDMALRTLRVSWVINCTGPSTSVRQSRHPLLTSLCSRGLVRPDPLGLGLEVGPGGSVLDRAGHPSDTLFTLGPLQKGRLWETTAVPELRTQAAQLAQALTHSLSLSQASPVII